MANRTALYARIQKLYPVTLEKARKEEFLNTLHARFGFTDVRLMTMPQLDHVITILEDLNRTWSRPLTLVHSSPSQTVTLPKEKLMLAVAAIRSLANTHKMLEQFYECAGYQKLANDLLAFAGEAVKEEVVHEKCDQECHS